MLDTNKDNAGRDIEYLATLLDRFSLTRLEYEREDYRLILERAAAVNPLPTECATASWPTAQTAAHSEVLMGVQPTSTHFDPAAVTSGDQDFANTVIVRAPLVGVAYHSREPNAAPLVIVGSQVHEGDVLCLVEAMKMFNEITAPVSGVVQAIHFLDGQLMEHGAALISILPVSPTVQSDPGVAHDSGVPVPTALTSTRG